MSIRLRKATIVLAVLWLFTEGIALGILLRFRNTGKRLEETMRSIEETISLER